MQNSHCDDRNFYSVNHGPSVIHDSSGNYGRSVGIVTSVTDIEPYVTIVDQLKRDPTEETLLPDLDLSSVGL